MPDLDELDSDLRVLADHGARSARGLPSADVRHRGARRRRLRLGGTALAAVAVLAAGALVAGELAPGGDDGGLPATTTTTPDTGLPSAVLPAGEDLLGYNEITGWATESSSATEDRQVSVCQASTLTALGATSVRLRAYVGTVQLEPGTVSDGLPPSRTDVVVGEFPDAFAGQAAYDTVLGWVQGCATDGRTAWGSGAGKPVQPFGTVTAPGGTGQTFLVLYDEEPAVDPDMKILDAHGVGISADGTRVVLLSQRYLTSEYHYEPADAPVTQALTEVLD